MKKRRILYALAFTVLLLTEIAIALFVHDGFIRPYFGDVLVTILLCSLCRVVFPKGVSLLTVYVFLFAVLVEIAQYFHIVDRLGVENNAFLRTVIGTSFAYADILCYAVGCLAFWVAEKAIRYVCVRRSQQRSK